jgi:protein gp37
MVLKNDALVGTGLMPQTKKVEQSKIQWTGPTWNPWHGCIKVSDGCKVCYLYRDKERYGQEANIVLRSKTKFNEPLKWMEPQLIFTCSWSDFFIENADEWRTEAWEVIKKTPHHNYQILTKRPERVLQCLPKDWEDGYNNVWLGTSIESQKVIHRLDILAQIPAKIKFISFEPLLSNICLSNHSEILKNEIDWAIIGGESGNDKGKYTYRDCNIDWITNLIEQNRRCDVKVFVKQLGTHLSKELEIGDRHAGIMEQWPIELQIREFPIDIERFRLEKNKM